MTEEEAIKRLQDAAYKALMNSTQIDVEHGDKKHREMRIKISVNDQAGIVSDAIEKEIKKMQEEEEYQIVKSPA